MYSTLSSIGDLFIDLEAIGNNYGLLSQKAFPAACAAVVKANAYGLGIQTIASTLAHKGCTHFFVATFDEALTLRLTLPSANIYILHGILSREEADICIKFSFIPIMNHQEQFLLWAQIARELEIIVPLVLHVDTGMNRLGFDGDQFKHFFEENRELLAFCKLLFIMSHLSCADIEAHPLNQRQLSFCQYLKNTYACTMSLANSSGIFLGKPYHFDLVRPGCALYGINPTPLLPNPMQEVLRLQVPILQIRHLKEEDFVGYGGEYKVNAGDRLAVIAIGYADGYPRNLTNKSYVSIQGNKAPIVGIVSMDLVIINVTHIPDSLLYCGAQVEIIGSHVSIDTLASLANTNGYEFLTRVGNRFKRHYINAPLP